MQKMGSSLIFRVDKDWGRKERERVHAVCISKDLAMKEEKIERRSIPVSSIQLNSYLDFCLEIHTNIAKYRASIACFFFMRQEAQSALFFAPSICQNRHRVQV